MSLLQGQIYQGIADGLLGKQDDEETMNMHQKEEESVDDWAMFEVQEVGYFQ